MKLPNASSALVDLRKLIEYALDEDSPRGRHKARVFKSALGITAKDAPILVELIREAVIDAESIVGEQDFYGQRYAVDCKINFENRRATVRMGWMIRRGERFPRMTTCFVIKGA